jgi:hypothetical protein
MDLQLTTTETLIAGKTLILPAVEMRGRTVIITGKCLRMATVKDEELVEHEVVPEPAAFIQNLRSVKVRADVLSFPERPLRSVPKYPYYWEWDNRAVVRITSFDDWWRTLPQTTRKNVRRSAKRALVVRIIDFDDALVEGIRRIYDAAPFRDGRRFWHYGKDSLTVKREIGNYLDRSDFIGAFVGDELVGFIKLTYVDRSAQIMQILGHPAHQDARPVNALLARAVELCCAKGLEYLIYGKLVYRRNTRSLLTEFKRRNGFEELRVRRYFVPLTCKGAFAMKFGLHVGIWDRLPPALIDFLLKLRSRWYHLRASSVG